MMTSRGASRVRGGRGGPAKPGRDGLPVPAERQTAPRAAPVGRVRRRADGRVPARATLTAFVWWSPRTPSASRRARRGGVSDRGADERAATAARTRPPRVASENRRRADETVAQLWSRVAPGGALVLVEPGTPNGSRLIRRARQRVLDSERDAAARRVSARRRVRERVRPGTWIHSGTWM